MNAAVSDLERLARALAEEEYLLHYQPKVDMRGGHVVGVEALLRWQPRDGALILPGAFIPLIQDHDLILDVGRWVIDAALDQADRWRERGIHLPISVNVAARQLLHPDFPAQLQASLERHPRLPTGLLELEILESAALDNTQQARVAMRACRELGVSFALDDFGTGYSSLAYLREIPAETLKIDRRFIADLLDDGDDLILVEGVVSLARAFRRQVVAEGVETGEQGLMLMRLGCDIAQGFGIGRPMPADAIPEWLARWRPDPQWALWADIPWEMADFPLLVAKHDHISWVRRVMQHLEGDALDLEQTELTDHHKCRFGHWYDHQGRERYGHLPVFHELDPIHQLVHHLGPEIVRLRAAGALEQARLLARELERTRDRILGLLDELQLSVAREPVGRAHRDRPSRPGQAEPAPRIGGDMVTPRRAAKSSLLLVDHGSAQDARLLAALAHDHQVECVTSAHAALAWSGSPPDLILLAVDLQGADGFELCRQFKENPVTRGIPVIFLSHAGDAAEQVRCFNAGAVDYISHPRHADVVAARVRTHVNLKQRAELLEAQASIDALTGVPNRRRFDETLRMEWRRAARHLTPLSLLMIDVDHFKAYNDHYGHGAGDECLRHVGAALLDAPLRPGDFVARYGGEEFAVILPGCHIAGAETIGERIRAGVEALALPHARSSASPHVTLSVGAATQTPANPNDASELLRVADVALYRAKQGGRNRVARSP